MNLPTLASVRASEMCGVRLTTGIGTGYNWMRGINDMDHGETDCKKVMSFISCL